MRAFLKKYGIYIATILTVLLTAVLMAGLVSINRQAQDQLQANEYISCVQRNNTREVINGQSSIIRGILISAAESSEARANELEKAGEILEARLAREQAQQTSSYATRVKDIEYVPCKKLHPEGARIVDDEIVE